MDLRWTLIVGGIAVLFALFVVDPIGRRIAVTMVVGLKYGALLIVDRIGLRRSSAADGAEREPLSRPRVLRCAFEDLGPTYVKLGQIIASSPGLFTEPYVKEFRKVLDRVRPLPYSVVAEVVADELGERRERLELEATPLASASIAQVHRAVLDGERDVVVKIQRPGIEALAASDMQIMHAIAEAAYATLPDVRLANPVGVVEDFSETLQQELDFAHEGRNMDEFNQMMNELGHERVAAPEVLWDLTTRRVLTMERFAGHTIDAVDKIKKNVEDPEEMLLVGMRAWLQTVMLYGFFHGDVHAGNLMWLDDGRIGFLDFGIVGRFTDEQRKLVTRYIMAMATAQYRELTEVVLAMGSVPDNVDKEALAADMAVAYAPLRQMSLGEMQYSDLLPNILAMSRKHQVRMPQEFILILKQVLYFDRYARLLAPQLNVFSDPRLFSKLLPDVQRALSAG